ncbi:MAG: diguanylate cyclase (GGDEF)-like protein [Gammaproteobacteria bacterium]
MLSVVDSELKQTVNQLSTGIGLLDSTSFMLVAANRRLKDWLNADKLPIQIDQLLPEIKTQRLEKVTTKNRRYRNKIGIVNDGIELFVDFSFTKITASNGETVILIEGVQDDTKQEVDALIKSYQETMENYKTQLIEQKEIALQADRERAIALEAMNENLETQVRKRTEELEAAKEELSHQAHHDVLTGLPNRRLFDDRLHHAMELSLRSGAQLALFYIDLDEFKKINDSLGHRVGDELLVQSAGRLNLCIREADTIARVGGDEFSIIAENTSRQDAEIIARKILDQLSRDFFAQDNKLNVSASIGICMSNALDGASLNITQAADAAMYQAKLSGKNNYHFFAQS